MRKVYLITLMLMFQAQFAFPQANAGPDKTVSGTKGTKIGTAGDKNWCYFWEASPADPSLVNEKEQQPTVNPAKTTKYTLTVTGPDFSFIKTDEVTVYRFEIEYFRHSAGKEWKVVVGEPIEFSAIASADCKDWDWDMEDGFPDTWNPTGGNVQKGSGMKIPDADLASVTNNSDLGSAYGTLNVSCEDGEGNDHEISSDKMSPAKKVEVFFKKDDKTNKTRTQPNWFYYWQQFIPMGRIATLKFSSSMPEYGSTKPRIRETVVSQIASERNDETTHRGLHTFYETIAHENHHIVLWEGWWGAGGSPVPANDTDKDTYPDTWESTDPGAIAAGFIVGVNDDYSLPGSVGYAYEERECRAVEHAIVETAYDKSDWSYDPSGTNQGKQW